MLKRNASHPTGILFNTGYHQIRVITSYKHETCLFTVILTVFLLIIVFGYVLNSYNELSAAEAEIHL